MESKPWPIVTWTGNRAFEGTTEVGFVCLWDSTGLPFEVTNDDPRCGCLGGLLFLGVWVEWIDGGLAPYAEVRHAQDHCQELLSVRL